MSAAAVRNLRGFGAQRLRFGVLWGGGICNAYIKQLYKKYLIALYSKYKLISLHDDNAIYCCYGKVLGVVEECE